MESSSIETQNSTEATLNQIQSSIEGMNLDEETKETVTTTTDGPNKQSLRIYFYLLLNL